MDDPGLTRMGQILGSPRYMSPEQLAGKPINERSDVFSLGLVLYFLLTGTPLFDGESVDAILDQHERWHENATLDELQFTDGTLDLMRGLLAWDPDDRLRDLALMTRLPQLRLVL